MRHRRNPGVEHGGDPDASAQMPWVRRARHHRLRRRAEQEVVDDRLVPPGDLADLGRQREDDVEIADRQQIGPALGEPDSRGGALASGTMAIAARVISDPDVAAVVAAIDMAAERRRPAVFDRRHDLELGKAQVTGLNGAIAGPFNSEDIGDLKRGAQAASAAVLLSLHQRVLHGVLSGARSRLPCTQWQSREAGSCIGRRCDVSNRCDAIGYVNQTAASAPVLFVGGLR